MKKNKIVLIGIFVIAVLAVVLGIVFGKGKKEVTSGNPEFARYIYGYTSGVISRNSPVRIRFTESIEQHDGFDYAGLFDFSPDIKGTCYWVDDRTLEFKPEESLPSDERFVAEFSLGKLMDVPKELARFSFEFHILKQSFNVSVDEIKTIDKTTLRWQKIIGRVQTADTEDPDRIKDLLTAVAYGKKLNIIWESDIEGTSHRFEIDSIERKETAGKILIEWSGKCIGVDKKGNKEITIPALGDFSFISASIVHQPEQYLKLQFSDPLKENQPVKGLVNIKGMHDLRYIVEDNIIKVFPPERVGGAYTVEISEGLQNVLGYKLKEPASMEMYFEELKPEVRLVNKGVILPDSHEGLVFPFEAVNLSAVDVRIVRIYENNLMQFLQVNEMDGSWQLQRVGKAVVQTTVPLAGSDVTDLGKWNRFSLDLNKLITAEHGAIYRITIGFRKKHSLYACEEKEDEGGVEEDDNLATSFGSMGDDDSESSYWDYYDDYYYGEYEWEERDNPCSDSYYGSRRSVSQNILASNLGLIAKKGNDGSLRVYVTDMKTTKPMKDVTIDVYDYQQQLLQTLVTTEEGMAVFTGAEDPYFVIARSGDERGYLKLNDGTSLSLSRFDIAGVAVNKGMKGFIYGERGVWRPGDSLYVTFVLEEAQSLPERHPVVFELRNPLGQLTSRIVQNKNDQDFYTFRFNTDPDAPTGNWGAKVTVGGVSFYKTLKIETIKPNRLKIKFDFEGKYLTRNHPESAQMNVKWLHGAVGKDLNVLVDVILNPVTTYFEKFKDFVFDDPSKTFSTEQTTIFDGTTDAKGNCTVVAGISTHEAAPGKLNAVFVTKAFEPGGDFSTDRFSLPYNPYDGYIGLKLPKGDKMRGMLLTDTTHTVRIVTVTPDGELDKSEHLVKMEFYKIDWKWWWDNSADNLSNYVNSSYNRPLKKETVYTKNGQAEWGIRISYPDWGRYL
ncbi:MAG: hypothetical protein KJ607_04970, partial [Bacteroidetes bacterium]|nr:hypothetical protein [Bacteroidota bacterium]